MQSAGGLVHLLNRIVQAIFVFEVAVRILAITSVGRSRPLYSFWEADPSYWGTLRPTVGKLEC